MLQPVRRNGGRPVARAQDAPHHRADGVRIPAEVGGQQHAALEGVMLEPQAAEGLGNGLGGRRPVGAEQLVVQLHPRVGNVALRLVHHTVGDLHPGIQPGVLRRAAQYLLEDRLEGRVHHGHGHRHRHHLRAPDAVPAVADLRVDAAQLPGLVRVAGTVNADGAAAHGRSVADGMRAEHAGLGRVQAVAQVIGRVHLAHAAPAQLVLHHHVLLPHPLHVRSGEIPPAGDDGLCHQQGELRIVRAPAFALVEVRGEAVVPLIIRLAGRIAKGIADGQAAQRAPGLVGEQSMILPEHVTGHHLHPSI